MKNKNLNSDRYLLRVLLTTHYLILITHLLYGAFETYTWGARPTSMGGAFVALADDSNAILWNPSGVAQLKKYEASFMYAFPYTGLGLDLGYSYLTCVMPISGEKMSAAGLSWASHSFAGIYKEDVFALCYSRELSPGILCGLTAKYLLHSFSRTPELENDPLFKDKPSISKGAVSFDAGLLYKKPGSNLSIGAAIDNLNEPDVGFFTTDKVSRRIKLGLGYVYNTPHAAIIPAVSIINQDNENLLHLGGEVRNIKKTISGRVGYNPNEITLGLSLSYSLSTFDIQVDYSYGIPSTIKGSSGNHNVALVVRFGQEFERA